MVTANSTEAGRAGTRPRSRRRLAAWLAIGALAALPLAPAVRAAGGVELSTPYAAVAVEPGNKASFALDITSNVERRVNLAIIEPHAA